jgi:hypothetical protein
VNSAAKWVLSREHQHTQQDRCTVTNVHLQQRKTVEQRHHLLIQKREPGFPAVVADAAINTIQNTTFAHNNEAADQPYAGKDLFEVLPAKIPLPQARQILVQLSLQRS